MLSSCMIGLLWLFRWKHCFFGRHLYSGLHVKAALSFLDFLTTNVSGIVYFFARHACSHGPPLQPVSQRDSWFGRFQVTTHQQVALSCSESCGSVSLHSQSCRSCPQHCVWTHLGSDHLFLWNTLMRNRPPGFGSL